MRLNEEDESLMADKPIVIRAKHTKGKTKVRVLISHPMIGDNEPDNVKCCGEIEVHDIQWAFQKTLWLHVSGKINYYVSLFDSAFDEGPVL